MGVDKMDVGGVNMVGVGVVDNIKSMARRA